MKNGKLQLLDKDPDGIAPNGIAHSPDEKMLYVSNGGPAPNQRKIFAYDIQADDTVKNSRDGKRLGLSRAPEGIRFANLAFGDPDSKTLYLVSAKNLWRIRLNIPGVRP